MTQEEKAKAYDKKLAEAKEMLKDGGISQNTIDYIQKLFPELVEPEGERIRKAIINVFATHKDYENFYGASVEDILDWLEAQGEHKPLGFNIGDEITVNGQICKVVAVEQKPVTDFSDLRTWKYIVDAVWTEKEGIGQYLDSPFTEEVAKKLQKRFGKIEQKQDVNIQINPSEYINDIGGNGCYLKNTTQASTWSEEDEINLGKAIWYIENPAPMVVKDSMLVEWLKNLKGRVQPQHKQEWSEEDENRINHLIAFFEDKKSITAKDDIVYANWLKSLKDRYTWKPSEEQLHGLDVAITTLRCQHNAVIKGLDSLYIDLKKLKD